MIYLDDGYPSEPISLPPRRMVGGKLTPSESGFDRLGKPGI